MESLINGCCEYHKFYTHSNENWARKYYTKLTKYAEAIQFTGNIEAREYIQEAYHSYLVYSYNLS